jgi:hypothetical protein
MRELSGDVLLGLPVRLHGLQLARPVDILLDREALRAVGLDLLCGDDGHRFLPLATAAITGGEISIRSPLVLLEADQLDFYRSRSFSLGSLRGRPVQVNRRDAGILRDIVVAPSGDLVAVLVETNGGTTRLPADGTLRFAPERRSAA